MMVLDTSSKEAMEMSVATFLDISTDELCQYIEYAAEKAMDDGFMFNQDLFDREINYIINNLQPIGTIDQIMCFHLSRRLHNSLEDLQSYNLKELLLSDNGLVNFLKDNSIEFEEKDNHLILIYMGTQLHFEDTLSTDELYLRLRLGYNLDHQDYCFNGFAMRDALMKNHYARLLFDGPEFLTSMARYLNLDKMIDDYKMNSTYYCYKLIIPINEIVFDEQEGLSNEEKGIYLIDQICFRLLMYYHSSGDFLDDNSNPVIRAADSAVLPANYIVDREEITLDMLL